MRDGGSPLVNVSALPWLGNLDDRAGLSMDSAEAFRDTPHRPIAPRTSPASLDRRGEKVATASTDFAGGNQREPTDPSGVGKITAANEEGSPYECELSR